MIQRIFSFLSIFMFCSCSSTADHERKKTLIVPLPPYQSIVEEIAGDRYQVLSAVPVGFDEHSYEPSPKELKLIQQADLFFTIGLSFEKKLRLLFDELGKSSAVISLIEGLPLLDSSDHDHDHDHDHCHDECADLHVWTSPKMVEKQVEIIIEALSQHFPQERAEFEERGRAVSERLQQLDGALRASLTPYKGRSIAISHPTLTYFCHEYSIDQIPIEFEGKDPLPQQLISTERALKEARISTIFIQKEFSQKGATLLAERNHLKLVEINPLSVNYFEEMELIGKKIVESFHE